MVVYLPREKGSGIGIADLNLAFRKACIIFAPEFVNKENK